MVHAIKWLFLASLGLLSLQSCTKEVITPKANDEYKLIEEGKQHGFKYRIYDMDTEYGSVYVEARSSRGSISFIAQANPDLTGYEVVMPDDYIPTFCWTCWGDCVEDSVDDSTTLIVTMTPFCPECTVVFVTGIALGCASIELGL